MHKNAHVYLSTLTAVLLLLLSPAAWGGKATTGTLSGTVTVAGTMTPLSQVTVSATSTSGAVTSAVTSATGAYGLTLPAGTFTVACAPAGYTAFTKSGIAVVAGQTTTLNISLAAVPQAFNHKGKITSYNGPTTCVACHYASATGTNLLTDVFNSVHFQARSVNPSIDMPAGGAHGMADRACGIPGTSLLAGNFAGIATAPDGSQVQDGCGKCHIAAKPPMAYRTATEAINDIDCLICHARVYGAEWDDPANIALYGTNPEPHARKVVQNADGSFAWSQDHSVLAAQSVGDKTTAKACMRCHYDNMNGHKRSTPFDAANDVHAAKGFTCTSCHVTSEHKIPRGNMVTDGMAKDQTTTEMTCVRCHGPAPHITGTNPNDLNRHVANVACEVCHVPTMDAEHNLGTRAWAPFTLDPRTGVWHATPATKINGVIDPYSEYIPVGTKPDVRWFNGGASMLAQPFGSFADRASTGGTAQLYAFKPFVNGMLFDAGWFPGPPEGYDHVNSTWTYSMKYLYERSWAGFLQAGFVDSAYPTAQSYWNARPDMAEMLNKFPMMLYMNRATYLAEGDVVVGTPMPGPQTAATYPGLAKAIDQGMGRVAIDMGCCIGADPAEAGCRMWSGAFFGMYVPVDMNPFSPFMGELKSFITMSHAVKGPSLQGDKVATCYGCHYTATEYAAAKVLSKRVDFGLLGWPNIDANPIVDPMHDKKVVPAVDRIVFKYTTSKTAQTLNISTYVVDAARAPVANVTVKGTLTGPAGQAGLPFTATAVTGSTGAASINFSQRTLAAGTYTWTVSLLTVNGVNYPVATSGTYTK